MALIPGGLTSVIQPLDVSVNKPFRGNFRKLYIQQKLYTFILEWIANSWKALTCETGIKSFKKWYFEQVGW